MMRLTFILDTTNVKVNRCGHKGESCNIYELLGPEWLALYELVY